MKPDPETDLTFTCKINAPRALLWQCWTTPKHIKNVFVPKPHGVDACKIHLRIGGKFNTTMNVEGNTMESKGVFPKVVDGKTACLH